MMYLNLQNILVRPSPRPYSALASLCASSHAGVMLSEIMYDPQNADTNREWIEIYNNGTSAENIGGWQFGKPNVNAWTSAFPVGTMLNPGQALVITPSAATLDSDWGSGINRLQVSIFPGTSERSQWRCQQRDACHPQCIEHHSRHDHVS